MKSAFKPLLLSFTYWVGGSALFATLAGTTCPTMNQMGSGNAPATPTGDALFKLIMETDPYQNWNQFPEVQGTVASNPPHGPMSRIFINSTVRSALTGFTGNLPDGAIIVKENIGTSPDVTEAVLTVMWKVQGVDPANNDWFWANMTPDGQIVAEGTVQACAACHGGARQNDFVFVHQF